MFKYEQASIPAQGCNFLDIALCLNKEKNKRGKLCHKIIIV